MVDEQEKLTPEQVKNWRKAMIGMLGPYALIMPIEQVQAMRDKMQEWCDEEVEKANETIN